ncbi:hypothetical protein ACLB2K_043116 [Fragaria x ananassa]
MAKTVSLYGFPTVESPEAVTKFLEEYTGEGTVRCVNVLPPKRRGSRSSAIVQFTTAECAEIILPLADDRRLWYGESYLKAREWKGQIASRSTAMATISEIPPETNNPPTNPPTTNAPVNTTTQTVINTTTANFLTIKLDPNNYSLWLAQITPLLESKNLMGFVNGTKPCPPAFLRSASGELTDAINPAYEEWMATDQMILGWINESLTPSVLSTVSRSISSHTTWASLSRRYASPNHNRILQLCSTLLRTTRGDLSISDYLDKINQVADTLALSGHPVADEDLISIIMNNVGPLYEHTISSAQARDTPITYDGLEALLLAAESRLRNHNIITLESAPTALVTNHSSTGGSRGCGSFNSSPRGRGNYSPRGSFSGPSSYSRGSNFPTHRFSAIAAAATSPQSSSSAWLLDTGSNTHITNDPNALTNARSYNGTDTVSGVVSGPGLQISNDIDRMAIEIEEQIDRNKSKPGLLKIWRSVSD